MNNKKLRINELIKLEEQGRYDEARKLFMDSTTPAFRAAWKRAFKGVAANTDWGTFNDIMVRYKAARNNPDHPSSEAWLIIGGTLTPKEIAVFYRQLRDPRTRPRGRPVGMGSVLSDTQVMDEIHSYVIQGMPARTAARKVLQEQKSILPAQIESRANYLARIYKQRKK